LGKWWGDLSRLGIVHLLVISGLHIGLVAGLGVLLGLSIKRILMIMTFDFRNKAFFSRFFSAAMWAIVCFFLQSASGLFSSYTARHGCGCFGYAV
jgi:competence protein ComEC